MSSALQVAEGQIAAVPTRHGVYIEFVGSMGHPLTTKSLEDRGAGIRLLNVRKDGEGENEKTQATVFIPHKRAGHFLKRIEEFRDQDTKPNKEGESKPKNQPLVASIDDIQAAIFLASFWTDDPSLIPGDVQKWVEVWLATDADESIAGFRELLQVMGLQEHPDRPQIKFPERTVVLVRANREDLLTLISYSDDLAEFRLGREPCSFFVDLDNADQAEWVQELLDRLDFASESDVSVCILDTGVNRGHPLIEPVLSEPDTQSVNPAWGTADHENHGTLMAGLGIYGDLQSALQCNDYVEVRHRIESVKILPPRPDANPQHLWGHVTSQAVSRAEIQAPGRKRVVCLATTSRDTLCAGRPTSWSAALDQLAFGDQDMDRRLIIVSAGNTDGGNYGQYPQSNLTDEIQDPAQSWNAVSVGGMTSLTRIVHPDYHNYRPVAPAGALSPCGCTSVAWDRDWPIKPDVVFESGNVAINERGTIVCPDELQVLSTSPDITRLHLASFNGTSAAAAQASWFASQLWLAYPDAWPETIRCLLVHSADWTEAMLALRDGTGKSSYEDVLRSVGYGLPDMERAVRCLRNRLSLVVEQTLTPFAKRENGDIGTNEIQLHALPWPVDELQALGEVEVRMKVTLSYFVEPGPGEVGWKDKYRYPSHGLRFDLNSPGESKDEFMKRINDAARVEGDDRRKTPSAAEYWRLGTNLRDKGSIHSDTWVGRAADLAASSMIAVFPTTGWWKERAHLARWNSPARYSLIVSIHSPVATVDLYTPVSLMLGIPIQIEIGEDD